MFSLSRRKVQIVIGLLWILDGFLQLQPKMFTSQFITQVVDPAKFGQPFFITSPIHFASTIFLKSPAVFDTLIAITQVTIGIIILFKKTTRFGLYLSAFWGMFVWFFGEAASGLFNGNSSLLMGLPGAALLYVLIALAILPKRGDKEPADFWLVFVWAAVWLAGAIYALLPMQNSTQTVGSMIYANATGAPGWLAHVDQSVGNFILRLGSSSAHMSMSRGMNMGVGHPGYGYIVLSSLIMLFIGLGVLINGPLRKLAVALGIIGSLFFWVVGQSLGGYFTGVMTDVQTAPLLMLLGLCVIGQPDIKQKLKRFYGRIEKALV